MVASDIRAGRAYVEVGVEDAQLRAGMNRAEARVREFARAAAEVQQRYRNQADARAGLQRRLTEEEQRQHRVLLANLDVEEEMAEVELKLQGATEQQIELARLEIQRRRMLAGAKDSGLAPEAINRLFNLREFLLKRPAPGQMSTTAGFASYALGQVSAGGTMDRVAKAVEESARELRAIRQRQESPFMGSYS